MPKIVYLLGAGASRSSGGPLIGDFRQRAEAALASLHVAEHVEPFRRALAAWDENADLNVEDFYVLAEVEARIRWNDHRSGLLNDLRWMIGKTIQHSMGFGPAPTYSKFVEGAIGHAGSPDDVTFITLNWDIALDNVLTVHGAKTWVDYGVDDSVNRRPPLDPGRIPVRLYKLHGSLNWWWCDKCHRLAYDPGEKSNIMAWIHEHAAPCARAGCNGHLMPLFVGPSMEKIGPTVMTQTLWQVWNSAAKAIREAEAIVVAGYSFPPNDKHLQFMLRVALAEAENLRGITIVSNSKLGHERVEFEEKNGRVFGTERLRELLYFRYRPFEQWVADGGHDMRI